MRIVFGVLMLLVVVAIVGTIAKKQLQATGHAVPAAAAAAGASVPPSGGDVATQARAVEQQVRDAANQALQQGARRASEAD